MTPSCPCTRGQRTAGCIKIPGVRECQATKRPRGSVPNKEPVLGLGTPARFGFNVKRTSQGMNRANFPGAEVHRKPPRCGTAYTMTPSTSWRSKQRIPSTSDDKGIQDSLPFLLQNQYVRVRDRYLELLGVV